jgi:hypothetical protein
VDTVNLDTCVADVNTSMSEEVIRLIEQSNLVPPNPHQLVTELLLPAILLQAVVAVARVFRARGGRDAAFQIVEMNFAAPILAVIGAIFAMLIVTFILFAARAGLSAWIEILTTAKSSTAVSATEVLVNMLYVQHVLVFTLLVSPAFLPLWVSSYRRLAAVFAVQLLFFLTFSKLADIQSLETFTIFLHSTMFEGFATASALAMVILSRYALPWVMGSMVAIPIYAALKAFRQKF